jgi:RNA polymerase sigma-70 factor (ECF subfamily)
MHDLARALDGRLVSLADEDAREFEARLADSSALAVRVAYGVLRSRQDAEDVAQEAFARAYRRFASLRDRDRFRGWLVRMTWRLALDHRRAARRRLARDGAAIAGSADAGDLSAEIDARERATRLWAAIDRLPERLRAATVLAAIDGHGVREVAALMGVAEGTIKSRLFEARQQLRKILAAKEER